MVSHGVQRLLLVSCCIFSFIVCGLVWPHTVLQLHAVKTTKTLGPNKETCFDVVVPFHPSDSRAFLELGGLHSIVRHVLGYRKIFIVSESSDLLQEVLNSRIIWFDEANFSFKKNDVGGNWPFQQVIKLLGPSEMPNLCETFVIVDADNVFVKDIHFVSSNIRGQQKLLYVYARVMPRHIPTSFDGLEQLLGMHIEGPNCVVHHQMVMQKSVLLKLKEAVREIGKGRNFTDLLKDAFPKLYVSEYTLYFFFMYKHYRERMQIEYLPYVHCHNIHNCGPEVQEAFRTDSDVVYITCHDHYTLEKDDCLNSLDGCSTALNVHVPKEGYFKMCPALESLKL